MNYRSIDGGRFHWLVHWGLRPDELRAFFHDKQRALIIKRQKLQNIPRAHKDLVASVTHFSEEAHGVFAEWLANQEAVDPRYASQLVSWFRSVEEAGLRLDDAELKKLARAGLRELYAAEPNADWITFLKTPTIDRSGSEEVDRHPVGGTEPPERISAPDTPSDKDLEAFTAWALGVGTASALSSPGLRAAAAVADAVRTNDRAALGAGETADALWESLTELRSTSANKPALSNGRGFIATPPALVDQDDSTDYLSLDVLCIPSRSPGQGPYFLDVLGFLKDGSAFSLGQSSLRAVLPEEGRVILHADTGLAAPHPGAAAAYRVAEYPSPRSIKIKVTDSGSELYSVMYVPHPSEKRDAVREWIANSAGRFLSILVLVLSDGVSIRARDANAAPIDGTFSWLFERWDSLVGLELGRRTYVAAPLPNPDGTYECAPVSVVAKKLLRSLNERVDIGLTNAQVKEISKQLDDPELALTTEHRARVTIGLEALTSTEPLYNELVDELMRAPAIQRDVADRKAKLVADAKDAVVSQRKLLENLKKATQSQEERLAELKAQADSRVKEVRLSIRKAFDVAREKECDTLGTLALWQGLLSRIPSQTENKPSEPDTLITQSVIANVNAPDGGRVYFLPSNDSMEQILASAGVGENQARSFASATRLAMGLGVPVVIFGIGARYVSLRIARNVAKTRVEQVDVTFGLMTPNSVNTALSDANSDVLLLQGADLSDATIYAPKLLELIAERVCNPQTNADRRQIIAATCGGASALPLPAELRRLVLTIDLDMSADDFEVTNLGEPTAPLQRKLWARIKSALEEQPEGDELLATVRRMMQS